MKTSCHAGLVSRENLAMEVCVTPQTRLSVDREKIIFYNKSSTRLMIEVTVDNLGQLPSRPQRMWLQWARFGAFLPWYPLTTLAVPAIDPGANRVVTTEVEINRDQSLGDMGASPPGGGEGKFSGSDEDDSRPAPDQLEKLDAPHQVITPDRQVGNRANLDSFHWVGNLNVLMEEVEVERHIARELRIYPGMNNQADFVIGASGKPDSLKIETFCDCSDFKWEFFERGKTSSLTEGEWFPQYSQLGVNAEITPSKDATCGKLDVHISRLSDGREAVVEFDLKASADGPGCYTT